MIFPKNIYAKGTKPQQTERWSPPDQDITENKNFNSKQMNSQDPDLARNSELREPNTIKLKCRLGIQSELSKKKEATHSLSLESTGCNQGSS